jgi:hypothetical protein
MEEIKAAIQQLERKDVTFPESLAAFRQSAITFAVFALNNHRGEVLVRALNVSAAIAEYCNYFDEEPKEGA